MPRIVETSEKNNLELSDLDYARRQLQDIAIMAARAAVSEDPREVAIALAVLGAVDRQRAAA
jgi:hypothetical protein